MGKREELGLAEWVARTDDRKDRLVGEGVEKENAYVSHAGDRRGEDDELERSAMKQRGVHAPQAFGQMPKQGHGTRRRTWTGKKRGVLGRRFQSDERRRESGALEARANPRRAAREEVHGGCSVEKLPRSRRGHLAHASDASWETKKGKKGGGSLYGGRKAMSIAFDQGGERGREGIGRKLVPCNGRCGRRTKRAADDRRKAMAFVVEGVQRVNGRPVVLWFRRRAWWIRREEPSGLPCRAQTSGIEGWGNEL